jgi:hypothetical protein
VGDRGGLAAVGDAELGEDVGDVDAGVLGLMNSVSAIWRLVPGKLATGARQHRRRNRGVT